MPDTERFTVGQVREVMEVNEAEVKERTAFQNKHHTFHFTILLYDGTEVKIPVLTTKTTTSETRMRECMDHVVEHMRKLHLADWCLESVYTYHKN